jgi:hypothetical protein
MNPDPWFLLYCLSVLYGFLSLKNDANVVSNSNKQKIRGSIPILHFEGTFTSFFKDKSHKEVTKQ